MQHPMNCELAIRWRTRHADRAPQEVAELGGPGGQSGGSPRWHHARVARPQRLTKDDTTRAAAPAVLVDQHHRAPEDRPLQLVRRRQQDACNNILKIRS